MIRVNEHAKIIEMNTKASEPKKVDAYMSRLKHPLAKVVKDCGRLF
jgi:hypothetical protein